jgi:enterochelin esterase-like enzyme
MTVKKLALPEISWVNPFKSDVPGLKHMTFFSTSMQKEIGYAIYLPPGYIYQPGSKYEESLKKSRDGTFPVIYWLHGKGGDETSGFQVRFPEMYHKAIIEGKAGQAIIVFPNSGNYSMFCDSYDDTILAETALIKELIPIIDSTYHTIKSGAARAIEGFSMGGFGAIKLSFKYPDLFSSVITYAGSFHDLETLSKNRPEVFERMFSNNVDYFQKNSPYIIVRNNTEIIKKHLRLMFVNGSEDFTLPGNYKIFTLLDELGISYDKKILDGFRHIPGPYYDAEGLNGIAFHFSNFRRE